MAEALDQRDFSRAMALRGHGFTEILDIYLRVRRMRQKQPKDAFRVALLFAGAPAAGMNAAAKTVIRELLNYGHTVLGVHGGFRGLARGDMKEMQWSDVSQWSQVSKKIEREKQRRRRRRRRRKEEEEKKKEKKTKERKSAGPRLGGDPLWDSCFFFLFFFFLFLLLLLFLFYFFVFFS